MKINLLPFTVLWMVVAVVVIGLILYRAWIARREDDTLHVHQSEIGLVSQQATTAQKLESIDRWGQTLTVIALLYGLAMAVAYIYQNLLGASNNVVR
jgi:uncharacterized membrane protein